MTLFNKFNKFARFFPYSASSSDAKKRPDFFALDNMLQDGYQNLRDNISLALLSHMRAELRYRINEMESCKKNNHSTDQISKNSGIFSLPLTRAALFIFSLSAVFSLIWFSDSSHYEQKATISQNHKKNVTRKENRVNSFLSPLISGSLLARQNFLEQNNPLLTHFGNTHKKLTMRKMTKTLWPEDKEKVPIQNTFAPIPHQLPRTQGNERDGFFVHDYLPQSQRNFIAVGYTNR